ncbi:MAG TPA: carboxypeptidase-like regulatory domain-containing protein [Planctomycetota bacterium]
MTRPRVAVLVALALAACRPEAPAPAAPARLSVAEAQAALEAREATRAPAPVAASPASARPAPPPTGEVLTLGARLLDHEARPLTGAELAWLKPTEGDWQAVGASARADAAGAVWLVLARAEVAGVAELQLVASAEGTVRQLLRLPRARFEGQSLVSLGELQLARGGGLRGRVRDEWGGPLEGVGVGLGPELAALPGWSEELRPLAAVFPLLVDIAPDLAPPIVRSAPDGSYELGGLPPGRFMVVAAAPPDAARLLVPARVEGVTVEAGQTSTVPDLVLRAARPEESVAGRVLAPDGSPLAGAGVVLVHAGARYAGGGTTSDAHGRFALLVPAGLEVELHAHDPQGRHGAAVRGGVRAGLAGLELRLAER